MDLLYIEGFDWDDGNRHKSFIKHNVSNRECEEVFVNKPLLLKEDITHSNMEERWHAMGKADSDRRLFISYTIRNNLIRIISARNMNKKEKNIYEKEI